MAVMFGPDYLIKVYLPNGALLLEKRPTFQPQAVAINPVIRPFRNVTGVHPHHVKLVRQRVDRYLCVCV